jgi:hypothetical protein
MASSLYFGTPEEYKKGDLHLKTVWIYRKKIKNRGGLTARPIRFLIKSF